jgi:hypothetical protein
MTVAKGSLIIALSAAAFPTCGGLIGYTLGVYAPAYYRGVFSAGRQPWFDPVEVGLGLGVTQGGICGVIAGAVVVLAVAWYNSRRNALDVLFSPHTPRQLTPSPERPSEEQPLTGRQPS